MGLETRHPLIPITDRNAAGIFMRAGRVGTKQTFEPLPQRKDRRMRERYRSFWVEEAGSPDNSQHFAPRCISLQNCGVWVLDSLNFLSSVVAVKSVICISKAFIQSVAIYIFCHRTQFCSCLSGKSMTSRGEQSACRDRWWISRMSI